MKTSALKIVLAAVIGFAGLASLPRDANAIPTLQLGIAGGVYDWSTQTIVSTGPSFALYAFLDPNSGNPLTDTYYLSMAVTPQVSSPEDLGSFSYNSTNVNVTSDMTYGTPPIDAFSSSHDAGDLAPHGVFPTYFKEVEFSFSASNQSAEFNTQDQPTWGPQTGSGMYYNRFDIDTTNLAAGYAIHFDLYNTKLCTNTAGSCDSGTDTDITDTDTDITKFAPFSHDAQSATSVAVIPEPGTYAMILAGLSLMGLVARRRKPG